ncbi:CCR4-NOT transcription complex subunit 1, TTP binding domain [Cinara cedri]|uniref:CCR4-NOT transcription complex subunit 1, TTP binding domain n=1 Tax=Cinara cedri TaxID=506608 RepID=A0A5E4M4T1_9HEMI|nr:CCR4-NOT transcription complex subunit 1, TTP binding domain [Cinara cedri]
MAEKMSTAERITKVRFWRLYYSAVIQQTNSVDDVIHLLEKIYYKPKGKKIMSQMLDHLLGQYQYFSTYKRHELILAGRLYGGVINKARYHRHLIEKTTKEVLSWSEEFSQNMKITQNTGDDQQSKRIKNNDSDNDHVGKKATKKILKKAYKRK